METFSRCTGISRLLRVVVFGSLRPINDDGFTPSVLPGNVWKSFTFKSRLDILTRVQFAGGVAICAICGSLMYIYIRTLSGVPTQQRLGLSSGSTS